MHSPPKNCVFIVEMLTRSESNKAKKIMPNIFAKVLQQNGDLVAEIFRNTNYTGQQV